MKPIRRSAFPALALLFALGQAPAHAATLCSEACMALMQEGQALSAKGKFNEALDKYRQAQKAEPEASLPLSMEGSLILSLSSIVKPELKPQWRDAARALSNRALALVPTDSVALETLRKLDDDAPPLHAANAAAAPLLAEGEIQFGQQHFAQALKQYEAAMQADPQLSAAWLGAGDCYYAQKDYAKAEAMFRRAAEIEPRNSQAWRYLSDALAFQDKLPAAEAALISAIEADPSQRPNWNKLASLRAKAGHPLAQLGLRRGARVTEGADGGFTIHMEDWVTKQADTPDTAVRLSLAASEAAQRGEARKTSTSRAPYDIELQSWRTALKIADELKASTGKDLADPGLRGMQGLARDGQLEPALLLLQFRQAYRPQLEAWVAAHPGGVKAFIDRYAIAP
jgi:tetratricopeptide (TPR) repeat protein